MGKTQLKLNTVNFTETQKLLIRSIEIEEQPIYYLQSFVFTLVMQINFELFRYRELNFPDISGRLIT